MLIQCIIFACMVNKILGPPSADSFLEPTFISDPEKWIDWPTPPNKKYSNKNWWVKYDEDAKYLGHLFAGKSEFPWIVDIRLSGEDQETWATGNIVSADIVVTNCRAITYFADSLNSLNAIRVTYCAQYLHEKKEDYEELPFGVRFPVAATLHPLCGMLELQGDVGILQLSTSIEPIPPYVGYMPFPVNKLKTQIASIDLTNMVAQRRMCFVASFGRDYANHRESVVNDFKVKHRVYIESWARCTKQVDLICPMLHKKCIRTLKGNSLKNRLMCMRTRALVGTVCDHDRGAPVVCDDKVYGFVVRGVTYDHCNNRLPVEFIVAKIDSLEWFLRPHMKTGNKDDEESYSKGSTPDVFSALFVTLISTILIKWSRAT